jgi:hypothetical protein
MLSRMNGLVELFLIVAATALCGCNGDVVKKDGEVVGGAEKQPAKKSLYRVEEAFQLETVSVAAHANRIKGHDLWTFVPTLKVKPLGTSPPPPASQDLWLLVVYASGNPSPQELEQALRYDPTAIAKPGENDRMTIFGTSTSIDDRPFRGVLNEITLDLGTPPREPDFQSTMLIAPETQEQRWNQTSKELNFFIQGFLLSSIAANPDFRPPTSKGVAVVRLCGFDPEFIVLSPPLTIPLEGK